MKWMIASDIHGSAPYCLEMLRAVEREGAEHLLRPGDILLHGHTHVPAWERVREIRVMNPGSVSIPKAGSEHGYMTLDGTVYHEELRLDF